MRAEQTRAESSLAAHVSASSCGACCRSAPCDRLRRVHRPAARHRAARRRTPILLLPVRLETRFKDRHGARRRGAAAAAVGAHLSRRLLDRLLRSDADRVRGRERARVLGRDRGRPAASTRSGARRAGAARAGATAPAARRGSSQQFEPAEPRAEADEAEARRTSSSRSRSTRRRRRRARSDDGRTGVPRGSPTATLRRLAARAQALRRSRRAQRARASSSRSVPARELRRATPAGVSRAVARAASRVRVFPQVTPKRQPWARAPRVNVAARPLRLHRLPRRRPAARRSRRNPCRPRCSSGPTRARSRSRATAPRRQRQPRRARRAARGCPTSRRPSRRHGLAHRGSRDAQARDGFDRVLVVGIRAQRRRGRRRSTSSRRSCAITRTAARGSRSCRRARRPTTPRQVERRRHARRSRRAASTTCRRRCSRRRSDWLDKRDGQWLAEYLGVDPQRCSRTSQAADGTDQRTAARDEHRAVARHARLLDGDDDGAGLLAGRDRTDPRLLHALTCRARAPCPRFASARSRTASCRRPRCRACAGSRPMRTRSMPIPWCRTCARSTRPARDRGDWRSALRRPSHVGKAGDPHAMLLDILGLHSGSVEWSQRYAESLDRSTTGCSCRGSAGFFATMALPDRSAPTRATCLRTAGLRRRCDAADARAVFLAGSHNALTGGVVDDRPLSEYAADSRLHRRRHELHPSG